jgi:hypothetical protein
MEDRPQLGVIDVKRVARRIVHEPGDDLGRLDGDLPVGKRTGADMESERAAHDEHGGNRPA